MTSGSPIRVFVSYTSVDREWAEWIADQLEAMGYEPALQSRHFRPGENFVLRMHELATTSAFTIAVLSEAYLGSEFGSTEWAAAFAQGPDGAGRRLVPVRVAPCKPRGLLAAIIYIDLVGLTESEAQAALTAGLEASSKPVRTAFPGHASPSSAPAKPYPPRLGALCGVPELPPHYLERATELGPLKEVLGGQTRVGISGCGRVGVQGLGGIGKTVTAIALARDPTVRAAYPDGVYWVAFGQAPALLDLQLALARQLVANHCEATAHRAAPAFQTVTEGKDRLRSLLEQRRALVILDDVWSSDAADAFAVTTSPATLLVTTRDRGVLVGLGATEHSIGVLSVDAALKLLRDWSGVPIDQTLPPEAAKLATECGYLPLALAMLGAMVRLLPKRSAWQDALARIENADLGAIKRAFPDYPYPDLLRAIEVSIDALEGLDRDRYQALALFREEEAIPEGPLGVLWRLDGLETRACMARLANRSLATLGESRQGFVTLSLHDLQRDVIRRHRTQTEASVHGRFLDGYSGQCQVDATGNTAWHTGPDDDYFYTHLVWHLGEAGRKPEVERLLCDFAWLSTRVRKHGAMSLLGDYRSTSLDAGALIFRGALRAAAPLIDSHGEALAVQLLARLPLGELAARTAAEREAAGCILVPRCPTLASTGLIARLERALSDETNLGLSEDGRAIIGLLPEGGRQAWDADTGRLLDGYGACTPRFAHRPPVDFEREAPPFEFGVIAIVASPDATRFVGTTNDGTIVVWHRRGSDGRGPDDVRTYKAHASPIEGVYFLDEDRFVSVARTTPRDKLAEIKVWDWATVGSTPRWPAHYDWVRHVALTDDLRCAASVGVDRNLMLWDPSSGARTWAVAATRNSVGGVALTRDGRHAVTCDREHRLKLWDLESRQVRAWTPRRRIEAGADAAATTSVYCINAVSIMRDDARAVIASDRMYIVDLPTQIRERPGLTPTEILEPGFEVELEGDVAMCLDGEDWGEAFAVAVSPDNSLVMGGSGPLGGTDWDDEPDFVRVWDATSGELRFRLRGHRRGVTALAVGQRAGSCIGISASTDGTLIVWDLTDGHLVRVLAGHDGAVRSVVLTADTQFAISAGSDRTLRVWDVRTGQERARFMGDDAFTACAMDPLGTCLIAGDANGRVHFFKVQLPNLDRS